MARLRGTVKARRLGVRRLGVLVLAARPLFAADHCAPEPLIDEPKARATQLGLRALVGLEHATYATERYAGNYTGTQVALAYSAARKRGPAWGVRAHLPVYQLVRNGQDEGGIGDVFVSGRVRVWKAPAEALSLGASLGVSIPTGDAERDLGMGHFMLHPGLWLGMVHGPLRSEWALGYGGVLGSGDHAHDSGPLVNPMNSSEMSLAGTLAWTLERALELRAGAMAAVPVAAPEGEARAIVQAGLRLVLGRVDVTSMLARAVWGDPFDDKLEVTVGYSF